MKTINIIKMLFLSLVIACGFTACDNDDLSTQQYKGGINLNVFGPSPVARGGELRFLGSGMDRVTAVVFPGSSSEVTNITVISSEEIRVTVPQDAEVGTVTLRTPTGDITTQTKLTYLEPISLDENGISPNPVKPGETLTLSGEYLNLIKEVIFAADENSINNGIAITEVDFLTHERSQISLVVPFEAQSGVIVLADNTASEEEITGVMRNMIVTEGMEIVLPSVEAITDLSDKKPGDEIIITGKDLDLVTSVVMPNEETVEFTYAVAEDGTETLTFTLPENSTDGIVNMLPASNVEVPIASIGMALPTEVVAEPANELRVGDVITLTGVNMELVTTLTFPGVEEAVEPESVSETEVKVIAPEGFTSGDLLLNTASGGSVPVAIETQKPIFESFASSELSLGSDVVINGQNLDLVAKVIFTGGAEVEVESSPATQLTVAMPTSGAETGVLTLQMANGETVETESLSITAPEFCYIPVLPGEDVELRGGEVMTVIVENPDVLTGVQVNGQDMQYILLPNNSLYISLPSMAGAGSILKLVSSNGEVEYTIDVKPASEVETVIMDEMRDLASWAGEDAGGAFRLYKADLTAAGFAVGAKLRFYVSSYAYTQIQVNNANWGSYTMLEYNEGECPSMIELDVTQELYDNIMNTNDGWSDTGFVIQGAGCIVSKVSVWYEIPQETTIWSGEWTCSGWSGNQDLAWGGYDWSTFKSGQTIIFVVGFVDPTSGWACVSPRMGNNWGNLSVSQFDLVPSAENQTVEFVPSDDDISHLQNDGGLVITGDGFILKEVQVR